MFDLNPIDVLNQREMKVLPPHYSKIQISDGDLLDGKIKNWVRTRLQGRFCMLRTPSIDQNGNLKSSTFLAFEDHKELTYFVLACPYLRRN